MKYLLFVCEGLADEALEDLGGRTPLEAAKTPVLDALAEKGRVGQALFLPSAMEPSVDVVMLSILGYDPLRYYTGLAPLESMVYGLQVDDRAVIFRADLVTSSDQTLIDPFSGNISDREAEYLIQGLASQFSKDTFQFVRGRGYKNYLVVRDEAMLEELDELGCIPPAQFVGQKISKSFPVGKAGDFVTDLTKKAGAFLENHEINRVRIDLGENPANLLWLWGQGKKPKLPSFEKQTGLRGVFYAQADFVRGIGLSLGMTPLKEFYSPLGSAEFALFYFGEGVEAKTGLSLKSKISRLEAFDDFVGGILKVHADSGPLRVLVTGDLAESLTRKEFTRNPLPVLMSGEGIASEKNSAFSEKICGPKIEWIDKGKELITFFIKK